ncbi:MAG: pentapeptide repeat-containing protein [Rhodospirillaceae bacterium]|nr:pentapeptide repeat-containing protein [Rhodospirillaceae bacterium]
MMDETVYCYEIRPFPDSPVEVGEIAARDEDDARRQLRVRYLCPQLPSDTRLYDKALMDKTAAQARSQKLRNLLRVLAAHHSWLRGDDGGERADLSGLDLAGVDFKGADLTDADLSGTDLADADLRDTRLIRANLSQAMLRGADMRGSNLSGADLSEADLRDADLRDASFDTADVWRANFRGCIIAPQALHDLLGCKTAST